VATVHAFRGETTQALSWLERAYEQKDSQIISIKSDSLFSVPLAREPRFKSFVGENELERLKWEAAAASLPSGK